MLSHLSLTTRHEGEAIITHTSLGGNCAERLDVFPGYTTILERAEAGLRSVYIHNLRS